MGDTEKLIASLAQKATPVTPSHPVRLLLSWLGVSALYMSAVMWWLGLRGDLIVQFTSPLFMAEILSLALIVLTSGFAAVVLAFPDLHRKHYALYAPLIAAAFFMAVLVMEWVADYPPAQAPVHGLECLLCIALLAWLPAAWMLFLLRCQASVHYGKAGGMSMLAATAAGCLALRLSEETDSISHMIVWHYMPMVVVGAVGLWLGRKMLAW